MLQKAAAKILDSQKAETNIAPRHGKAQIALVNMRRQYANSQPRALCYIGNDLIGIIEHTGQQGRHVFFGVKTFKPRCLIGNESVGRGMRFVKRIGRKTLHLTENFNRRFFVHPSTDAAFYLNLAFLIGQAMDKNLLFSLHHIRFLFAHSTANDIGTAERIACELTKNLHYLFLVDNASVGNVQYFLKTRMLEANHRRIVAAFDISGNRLHRAGTVKGNNRNKIFHVLRTQLHDHIAHASRFKLENTFHMPRCHHCIDIRFILWNRFNGKIRPDFPNLLHGVMDDRKVAESKKINFEKSQLLKRGHSILCHNGVAILGQGYIIADRLVRNHNAGCVRGSVARHSFDFSRHIDKTVNLRI